jgi:hypothetical protein
MSAEVGEVGGVGDVADTNRRIGRGFCRDVAPNDEVFGDDQATGGSSGEEGRFRIVETARGQNGSRWEPAVGSWEPGEGSWEFGVATRCDRFNGFPGHGSEGPGVVLEDGSANL